MRNKLLALLASGVLILFSACTPGEIERESSPTEQPTLLQEADETPMNEAVPVKDPTVEPSPVKESGEVESGEAERVVKETPAADLGTVLTPVSPVVGDAPEALLADIIADLKTNQNISGESVEVVRAESVVWRDGSLGCPRPGMMYTQALVPGYQVILQHGDKQYDYRVSDRGTFFQCENDS